MDNETKSAVEIQVGHTYKGRDGHLRKVLSIDDNPYRTVTYEIRRLERTIYYEAQLIFGTDLGECESNGD